MTPRRPHLHRPALRWAAALAWTLVVGMTASMLTTPRTLVEVETAEVTEVEASEDKVRTGPGRPLGGGASVPSWLSHDREAAAASRERGAPPTPPPER